MRQLKIRTSITNRDAKSLEKYFQEVNKIEMISPEEEARLAALIKNGDQSALDCMVKANLRFVISVAKQYQHQGLSLSDLINEGNIGLIRAAKDFDQTRGFKFISYAVWWIRRQISQAIAAHARLVSVPLNKLALNNRLKKTSAALEQQLERTPTDEELASAMEIDIQQVTDGLSACKMQISLDSPLSEEGEESLLDITENNNAGQADENLNYSQSLKTEIDRALQVLTERQKEMLCSFFGIGVEYPWSLEALAEKHMISLERARQIKDNAIEKLRASGNFSLLWGFLGT